MRTVLGLAAALCLGLAGSRADAQTVESTFSLALVAQVSQQVPTGARIIKLRHGTRDVVEQLKAQLGVVGRGGKLAHRRAMDDPNEPHSTWLIVGSQEVFVPEFPLTELTLDLPEEYFAEVEAVKLKSDGNEVTLVEPVSLGFGVVERDGFQATLFGIQTSSVRFKTVGGVDIGYLGRRQTTEVLGGIVLDDDGVPPEADGVITGTIKYGPEKVVSP